MQDRLGTGLSRPLTDLADDPRATRSIFAGFPSGIAAIGAIVHQEPQVLLVSSFQVGISERPPLVLFAARHESATWPRLRTAASLGVTILSAQQGPVVRQIAAASRNRLDGIPSTTLRSDAVLLTDGVMWLEGRVHDVVPQGDHDVVFLRVDAAARAPEGEPAIWHNSTLRALADPAAG